MAAALSPSLYAAEVSSWGDNQTYGGLGSGTSANRSIPGPVVVSVGGIALSNVNALDAGGQHTLVIKSDGTVWAWGANDDGELGNGLTQVPPINAVSVPVQTLGPGGAGVLGNVIQVAAGARHSLALRSDGTVYAWGFNGTGQLGSGTLVSSSVPTQVKGENGVGFLTNVVAISAGGTHSLALKSDGTVVAWGAGWYGQLGDNSPVIYPSSQFPFGNESVKSLFPKPVTNVGGTGKLAGVIAIEAGYLHSLALKSDGSVWAWGNGLTGQLGNKTNNIVSSPIQVLGENSAGVLTGIKAISAGGVGNLNLALGTDNVVRQWGNSVSNTPVKVPGPSGTGVLDGVIAISAGQGHGLAIRTDHTLWAWGSNYFGELGIGIAQTTAPYASPNPVQVHGANNVGVFTGVQAVSAGLESSFVLTGVIGPTVDPNPNRQKILRASVTLANRQSNNDNFSTSVSGPLAGGIRRIAFASGADNLTDVVDANQAWDVFVKDVSGEGQSITGQALHRASENAQGVGGNSWSFFPSVSQDGNLVAFTSYSTNLVTGDSNQNWDVFVKNLQTGAITLASTSASGVQGNYSSGFYGLALSGDGSKVAFTSYANTLVPGFGSGYSDIFVKDLKTGAIVRASQTNDGFLSNSNSFWPSLSADGTVLAFESYATLAPGGTRGYDDIYVYNTQTQQVRRAFPDWVKTVGSNSRPSISADGKYIAFVSDATGLDGVDDNKVPDIYRVSVADGTILRVSRSSWYESANGESSSPSISADGRYVAFYSTSTNLVPGENNPVPGVFVKDLVTNLVWRVSRATDGTPANFGQSWPWDTGLGVSISADAKFVGFDSGASNLVAGDTNGLSDVFFAETCADLAGCFPAPQ